MQLFRRVELWFGIPCRKWKCDLPRTRDDEMNSVVEVIWMVMDLQERLHHLQAISREETLCTLVTREGKRTEVLPLSFYPQFLKYEFRHLKDVFLLQVQPFLLAAVSPFLANLLSQSGKGSPISIHPNPSWSVSINLNPCKSFIIHLNPSQSISIHTNPSQSISIHPNPSCSISIHPNPSQSISIPPNQAQAPPNPSRSLPVQNPFSPLSSPPCLMAGLSMRRSISWLLSLAFVSRRAKLRQKRKFPENCKVGSSNM